MVLPLPVGKETRAALCPLLPVTKDSFFRFSLKGIKNHSAMRFMHRCLHICGLRGIQGAAAQQDSIFARSLVGAKDDPLDLLDPMRSKKAQLLPGLRIGQERTEASAGVLNPPMR